MTAQISHARRDRRRADIASLVIAVATLAGCGGNTLPPAADPALARQSLTTALDAWKHGGKPDALKASSPPVQVIDRNWEEGSTLVSYAIQGEGMPLGQNLQLPVTLEWKDPRGKAVKKDVNYVVSTGEPVVVARQDIDD